MPFRFNGLLIGVCGQLAVHGLITCRNWYKKEIVGAYYDQGTKYVT